MAFKDPVVTGALMTVNEWNRHLVANVRIAYDVSPERISQWHETVTISADTEATLPVRQYAIEETKPIRRAISLGGLK